MCAYCNCGVHCNCVCDLWSDRGFEPLIKSLNAMLSVVVVKHLACFDTADISFLLYKAAINLAVNKLYRLVLTVLNILLNDAHLLQTTDRHLSFS